MVKVREAFLGFAALAAGVGAVWLETHRTSGPDQAGWLLALLVGWSFVASGLIAWRARPENRLGRVMVFTGFAWYAVSLTGAHDRVLFTTGEAVQVVFLAGFAFLVVSFPSGGLQSRFERALIAAVIFVVSVIQIVSLLFSDSGAILCGGCPGNLLEVTRNDRIANGLFQFQRTAGVGLAVAAIGLLATRWRRASGPQRRAVAPVLWAGSVTLVAVAVSVANDVLGDPLGQTPKRLMLLAIAIVPVAVLVVFFQRRLARGAVAGLVVELGEPRAAMDLREALARALGDPSLELAYWFPAESRYVDRDGRPVELPDPGAGRIPTVVEREGQPIAVLLHDSALEHNTELVDSVCAAAGLTLENERLQAELRARLAELQASRARLVEATEAERRRIERDLHDGTQQRLVSIAMSLGLLESKLPTGPGEARPIVRETRQALAAALEELRELTQGIHPTILAERGLPAALDELCRRAALPAHLDLTLDTRLPDQIEGAAYFFVSEALTNAAKHSHANEVRIAVTCQRQTLTIEVADDGIGGAGTGGGSGLRGLADRVEALGGSLTVSSPPGRGTKLRAEIPCG